MPLLKRLAAEQFWSPPATHPGCRQAASGCARPSPATSATRPRPRQGRPLPKRAGRAARPPAQVAALAPARPALDVLVCQHACALEQAAGSTVRCSRLALCPCRLRSTAVLRWAAGAGQGSCWGQGACLTAGGGQRCCACSMPAAAQGCAAAGAGAAAASPDRRLVRRVAAPQVRQQQGLCGVSGRGLLRRAAGLPCSTHQAAAQHS